MTRNMKVQNTIGRRVTLSDDEMKDEKVKLLEARKGAWGVNFKYFLPGVRRMKNLTYIFLYILFEPIIVFENKP